LGRLEGKNALIIGGSTGIGRAICHRFAEEGAALAVGSPGNEADRVDLLGELTGAGHRAVGISVDVRIDSDVSAAVARAIAFLGHVDILVNNAGVSGDTASVWQEPLAQYDRVMNVNARGVWLGMHYILPHMLERGYGRIINTASQLAHKPSPYNASYCASKAAVVALTVSAAQEVATKGITVNALCPGPTYPGMWQGSTEWAKWKIGTIPMQRVGTPDEQAWACVYMASDEAGYLTGQSISPNGGDVMW
jgi:NAD(P)-dependent dehydrogenase (short-subunit alcohol dehydrogenase family)